MQTENRKRQPSLVIKTLKYIFLACFWLVTIYWGILTYDIIVEGVLISPKLLIEGIESRIWHLSSEVAFSTNHDRLLLELSKGYLLYIAVSYLAFFFSFLGLLKKRKKKDLSIVNQDKAAMNRPSQKTLKWLLNFCFFAVTIVWCFYTLRLVNNLTNSKYGVESVIRQEVDTVFSKEQPLFVNSEIKGLTFERAARLISIVYLRYIGLIYLEAIFIFLFFAFNPYSKERQKERTNHLLNLKEGK